MGAESFASTCLLFLFHQCILWFVAGPLLRPSPRSWVVLQLNTRLSAASRHRAFGHGHWWVQLIIPVICPPASAVVALLTLPTLRGPAGGQCTAIACSPWPGAPVGRALFRAWPALGTLRVPRRALAPQTRPGGAAPFRRVSTHVLRSPFGGSRSITASAVLRTVRF